MRTLREFGVFFFGTPRRAIASIVVLVLLAVTGALYWLVEVVLNAVFTVFGALLIIAILWGILRFVLTGRWHNNG